MPPLTREQLRRFYHDGYLVLRGAVAPELVDRARALADADGEGSREAQQAALAALFNHGACKPAAQQLAGGDPAREVFRLIAGGQNAKRGPEGVSGRMEESGYPYDEVPWHNWTGCRHCLPAIPWRRRWWRRERCCCCCCCCQRAAAAAAAAAAGCCQAQCAIAL